MSKFAVKGIIAAVLAITASTGFTVTESTTLQVTARIAGGCVISLSGPMAFGDLSLTSGAAEVKQVTVTYKCANGILVSQLSVGGDTDGNFAGTMNNTSGVTDSINYDITWPATVSYTSTGFADIRNVVLTGTIPNANYATKSPGNYAQSVPVSINY
ncbi:MAG TPA: hypothetical protein VHL79_23335 [Ramlibacter sp.]|nr:hypothetical protein [Ramlibacter sp.]